jgi:hypothetical protein
MALKKSDIGLVGSVAAVSILLKAGAYLQPLKPAIDGLNSHVGTDNVIEVLLFGVLLYLLFEKSTAAQPRVEEADPRPLPRPVAETKPEEAVHTPTPHIEASPKIDVSPKFEFHGPVYSTVTHPAQPHKKPRHNLQFMGASKLLTDFEQEVLSADKGFRAVKACFLNQSIDGEPGADFNDAFARIAFRDNSGATLAIIDWPKWLSRDSRSRHVHIHRNTSACLLLAVYGNDRNWAVPFIEEREQGYWDLAKVPTIEGRTLPAGQLTVEIAIVGEDNHGLDPATVRLHLGEDGEAQIL